MFSLHLSLACDIWCAGIPDLLQLLVTLTQTRLGDRLIAINELQCTVLEVKVVEGLGTTMDVVLINGVLHENDTVVVCGLGGPIVTPIRSLLTPHPMKVTPAPPSQRIPSPHLQVPTYSPPPLSTPCFLEGGPCISYRWGSWLCSLLRNRNPTIYHCIGSNL